MSDPHTTAYARNRRDLLNGAGASGAPRRAALAAATDAWLTGLCGPRPEGFALVALGGYGRRELSPGSDLDVLLLHDGRRDPRDLAALAESLWYPVWDQGIALDHSVRTPAEAHKAAGQDLKVQLGLLDARHLAGDPALTTELRTAALAAWRASADRRLPELRELTRERARRHGELRFLLEPDLKEAQGGLRDATALRAVAASWLTDAPRAGLTQARAALLDVRDALHLTTGRTTDRLSLHDQDEVADALALAGADAVLRRVYEAAHTIGYAAEVTWRDVARILRGRSGRPRRLLSAVRPAAHPAPADVRRTPLAEGVVAFDGEVSLARAARPERDPVLPLRAAAAAARAGLPLNPAALRHLAQTAAPLPVPWPSDARRELVALLGAGESAVGVWEALDAAGLVTSLLPDWERVRCRPQRNPVHRWTVDRHLVETAVRAASATRRVRRPDLLLVAALLHDIGKGWPGDHSVVGEVIARDTAARMGFGDDDVEVLGGLVRHHLLLVETATRRDLGDPATVRAVADVVGGQDTLELLQALTEADALATGPAAWSTWRAGLVADLAARVGALFAGEHRRKTPAGDEPDQPDQPDEPDGPVVTLADEARRTGGPAVALDGAAYGARLLVALPDRPGALSCVAGVLALHRLTVRSAGLRLLPGPPPAAGAARTPPGLCGRPSSATAGGPGEGRAHATRTAQPGHAAQVPVLVLDWRVAAEYGAPPTTARLRADLVRALDGSLDLEARLAEREAAYRGSRAGAPAVPHAPPRVTSPPAGSRRATVLEVRASDAPGLLFRVGRALESAGVLVRSAHVGTLGAEAVDAFYVTDRDGCPLPDERAAAVSREVERALSGGPGAPGRRAG